MPREAAGRGDAAAKPLAVRPPKNSNAKTVVTVPAVPVPAVPPEVRPEPQRQHLSAAIPAKFHARARRDAAAFYLTQLAKGVLSGELVIAVGEQQIQLATAEFVILKIEAKQRKRANHVSVKLRWPRRPLIRVAPARGDRDGR
jgi:amphi-Trp domain-containing protein